MCKYETAMLTLREVFVNYPQQYKLNKDELAELEKERQDLLHAMEFINFNSSEGYMLSKRMQKVNQRRRQVKEDIEALETLQEVYHKKKINENVISDAIGKLRQVKNLQRTRGYRMKVHTDLQHMIDNRQVKVSR